MKIAQMVTMPVREETLHKVVFSLLDQVDLLRICLNGHSIIPRFLNRYNIEVVQKQNNYLGDRGKILWENTENDYIFLVDDDIIYPNNYIGTLVSILESVGGVVGVHAANMKPPVKNYYKDRDVYHFTKALHKTIEVDVLGTGTCAFIARDFPIGLSDCMEPNVLDCYLAVSAKKKQIKLWACKRPFAWLKSIPYADSIYNNRKSEIPTKIMNEVDW
jgi:hypothetical protein